MPKEGYLDILPANEIRFDLLVGQTLEKSLFLKNNSDYAVAFKVKTTAPKRYCVRPNSSVIKAHESMQVRIVMQPLKELPPPGQPFKDKFLVQACQTTAATDDAKAIFESTDKDAIIDQKLLCTFNIPGVDTSAHEPNDSAVNATARDTFEASPVSAGQVSIEDMSPQLVKPLSKPSPTTSLRAAAPAPEAGRGTSDGEGLKREADRLAKELREAREREAVLLRELAEEKKKNDETGRVLFELEENFNRLQKAKQNEKSSTSTAEAVAEAPQSFFNLNNFLLIFLSILVSILLAQQSGDAPSRKGTAAAGSKLVSDVPPPPPPAAASSARASVPPPPPPAPLPEEAAEGGGGGIEYGPGAGEEEEGM